MKVLQAIVLIPLLTPAGAVAGPEADTVLARSNLQIADSLHKAGKFDSARAHYNIAEAGFSSAKAWHAYVQCLIRAGGNETEAGEYDAAITDANTAIETGTRELGENDLDVATARYVLAYALTNKQDPQAVQEFERCLAIMRSQLPEDDLKFAEVYEGYSEYYGSIGDFDRNTELLEKVLAIKKKHLDQTNPDLAITYSNLGMAYQEKGRYTKASEYLEKAVGLQVEAIGENHPNTALMYNNLGMTYYFEGDNDRAVANYDKALAIYAALGENNPRSAFAHNNIAVSSTMRHEYATALEHYKKARDLFTASLGADHPNVAGITNNMGRTYFSMGKYAEAERQFRESLESWRKKLGDRHPLVGQSYFNLAGIALKRRHFSHALALLDSSLDIRRATLGPRHPQVADAYRSKGNVFSAERNYDAALRAYQQGLLCIADGFTDSSLYANPQLDQTDPRPLLLGLLAAKANTLKRKYAAGGGSIADLKISVGTYELASKMIDRLRAGYSTEGAKLYLSTESFGTLEEGIGAALALFKQTRDSALLETAFRFAERGKAGMLAEALNEADALKFAGLPDSLLEQEQSLRDDIAFYDTPTQKQREATKPDSAKLRESEDKLFEGTRAYNQLVKQFEQLYPSYYALKHRTGTIDIHAIQQHILQPHEALVEYVVGGSTCYVFVATGKSLTVTSVRHNGSLTGKVLKFRNALRNLDSKGYLKSAYELYTMLVAPVRKNLRGIMKLIIVPDGPLHHLPFEALITKRVDGSSPDFAHIPYLISAFECRYSISAALLAEESAKQRTEKTGFAGFAPVFTDRQPTVRPDSAKSEYSMTTRSIRLEGKTYPSLPESEREVRDIAGLFEAHGAPAFMYLHARAVKSAFEQIGRGGLSCLHIASHGFIDEKHPKLSGILFAKEGVEQDAVLYSGEIYNLDLDADLVVLSACESGLGKVVRGEGILGLTRGFLYAGARNLVVSLWQVADKSTADLMVKFYGNVLQGQPYSSALRNAKLSMIKEGTFAYPLEWGPFVLIGR